MTRRDLNREPCPDRILDDMGGAFGMGALGGFLWNFAKGWRNSPRHEKFAGGMFSGSLKAPTVGSAFATWGGVFCAFDCSLSWLRSGKEDAWNPVIAGAATGGVLSMRSGLRSCARSAAVGGVLLGIIEVVQIVSRPLPALHCALARDTFFRRESNDDLLRPSRSRLGGFALNERFSSCEESGCVCSSFCEGRRR